MSTLCANGKVDPESAFLRSSAISVIELDRFCEHCGYNLRTQPVFREPHTEIPVIRCPECGRWDAANHGSGIAGVWLRRVATLLLVIWLAIVLSGVMMAAFLQGAVQDGTLRELTDGGGQYTIQRSAGSVTTTWTRTGVVQVRADQPDYWLFVGVMVLASVAAGFVAGAYVVVMCPHWSRAAYLGLTINLPLAVAAVVLVGWGQYAPHLMTWACGYVALHVGVQIIGGIIGLNYGRALARVVIRITLPPTLRSRLAYLWLVDGKTP